MVLDTVSNQPPTFLDVQIVQQPGHAKYLTQHYLKPTALSVPLNPSSAHAKTIHTAWPKAYVFRARQLCSTRTMANHAQTQIVQRLRLRSASVATTVLAGSVGHVGDCPTLQVLSASERFLAIILSGAKPLWGRQVGAHTHMCNVYPYSSLAIAYQNLLLTMAYPRICGSDFHLSSQAVSRP